MKNLWRSPTLRSVLIFTVSGLGFLGANLILARLLPTVEYGLFTLVLALINLGFALGTLGLDGVVTRRHLAAGPRLLKHSLAASVLVGVALGAISLIIYELTTPMLLVVVVSTVAGGIMMVAAARFQSEQRFGMSLALSQSPNIVLIVAAIAVAVSSSRDASLPLFMSALGFVLSALAGWWVLFRERTARQAGESAFLWSEALSFAGVNAAGLLLLQLERLLIPRALSVNDLATFGVLAAIAGSLFRVMAMGVGYTLVPRLRAAEGVAERRRLIRHEVRLVAAILLAGSIAIWFVTPLVERAFLAGKYELTGALILATVVSGVAKIANSMTRAVVSALATPAELSSLNRWGWGSVAVATIAGLIGARWGLVGVIYGVTLGWTIRAVAGVILAGRHLQSSPSVAATARTDPA